MLVLLLNGAQNGVLLGKDLHEWPIHKGVARSEHHAGGSLDPMLRQGRILQDGIVQGIGALFDGGRQKLGVIVVGLERALGKPLLESVDLPLGGLGKGHDSPHVFQRILSLKVLNIVVLLLLHVHKVVGPALDFVSVIFCTGHELLRDLLSLNEVECGTLDHGLEFWSSVGHSKESSGLLALQQVGSGCGKLVDVRVVGCVVQKGLGLDSA